MVHGKYSGLIKAEARRLGFDNCGISGAEYLSGHASHLKIWLEKGLHGEMDYMAGHFEERLDPEKLVRNTRSVITVIAGYNTNLKQEDSSAPVISRYAFGRDYHKVIRKKLKQLLDYIQREIQQASGRVFVDSAPVLERAWAVKAGLGWIGKNSNLISPESGSFVFIGTVFIDLELEADSPVRDMCGSCTKCIDACPTQAIIRPKVINSNRCISYLTIEYKGQLPENLREKFHNRIFGCDICQEVCPWNRKAPLHRTEDFMPSKELLEMKRSDWITLDEKKFNRLFEGSAVKRAGFEGLKRNIRFVLSS
ncbi:MAG: tRNA epoxyqueuosine(34) reductase QueG [Bacteroidales bacterium]|nr:tRNA epoxyqueuosine(34) reductase QueG [Bacteroidales bacterium]